MKLSVIISSYKRLPFIRRTLYSLNKHQPPCEWQVVVAEEVSDETPLLINELKKYGFNWKVIFCEQEKFEQKYGYTKVYNNPSWTNNVAWKHSGGELIATLGNDIIIAPNCFESLFAAIPQAPHYILYTTTYNCPKHILDNIGDYSERFHLEHVNICARWPLQTLNMKTLVTNYMSLTPKITWDMVNGYDENFCKSIAAEDSDFSRRIMAISGSKNRVVEEAITIHQEHPTPQNTDKEFWDTGVAKARAYYYGLNESEYVNHQNGEPGWCEGFKVLTNEI